MKKLLFVGISSFLFVSCTKEWTCNCVTVTTASEEFGGDTVTKNNSYSLKGKKKEAEEVCMDKEGSLYDPSAISHQTTCDMTPTK